MNTIVKILTNLVGVIVGIVFALVINLSNQAGLSSMIQDLFAPNPVVTDGYVHPYTATPGKTGQEVTAMVVTATPEATQTPWVVTATAVATEMPTEEVVQVRATPTAIDGELRNLEYDPTDMVGEPPFNYCTVGWFFSSFAESSDHTLKVFYLVSGDIQSAAIDHFQNANVRVAIVNIAASDFNPVSGEGWNTPRFFVGQVFRVVIDRVRYTYAEVFVPTTTGWVHGYIYLNDVWLNYHHESQDNCVVMAVERGDEPMGILTPEAVE